MRRRAFLAAAAGGATLAGCLSGGVASPADPTAPATKDGTATPVRHTADGLAATFAVVDAHRPTPDDASATFDGDEVTVTGTMDPAGCRQPTLGAISYDAADGVAHLAVGTASPYGPTATVECDNASFDYRCVLAVERGRPTAVEVVHDYRGKDVRSFVLERD